MQAECIKINKKALHFVTQYSNTNHHQRQCQSYTQLSTRDQQSSFYNKTHKPAYTSSANLQESVQQYSRIHQPSVVVYRTSSITQYSIARLHKTLFQHKKSPTSSLLQNAINQYSSTNDQKSLVQPKSLSICSQSQEITNHYSSTNH